MSVQQFYPYPPKQQPLRSFEVLLGVDAEKGAEVCAQSSHRQQLWRIGGAYARGWIRGTGL